MANECYKDQANSMRTNDLGMAMIPVLTMCLTLFTGCSKPAMTAANGDRFIPSFVNGKRLQLVAKYEPLRIYIYADTNSTNRLPDYAVFEGYEPVFGRENEPSNGVVEFTHCENGLEVLHTERDSHERVLKRYVDMYDTRSVNPMEHKFYSPKYVYIDVDGDGLWDRFAVDNEKEVYMRSNFCWIPLFKR